MDDGRSSWLPTRAIRLLVAVCVLVLVASAAAQARPRGVRGAVETPTSAPNVTEDMRGVNPRSPNPLRGASFFVDKTTAPWLAMKSYERRGLTRQAQLMSRVATQPYFRWFGTWTHDPAHDVGGYLDRAAAEQPGAVPQIVTFRRIHRRPCGGRSHDGGPRADRAFVRWMQRLARAIGDKRVVIAFEPDSLGTLECSPPRRRSARLRMFRRGVMALARLRGATIYLEAGSSEWKSPGVMARRLRAIGVSHVRGFMLNVTHHTSNSSNYRYGRKVSRLLRGKPFVVSTTSNGRPVSIKRWCNRRNQAAGVRPTTNTGRSRLDAYLWIDRPGYAGGSCPGSPGAGVFWARQALTLGANAVR